jgi:hypothetical protein
MLFERKKKNHAKFVTPEWVVECARKGRRVGEAGFSGKLENEVRLLFLQLISPAPSLT